MTASKIELVEVSGGVRDTVLIGEEYRLQLNLRLNGSTYRPPRILLKIEVYVDGILHSTEEVYTQIAVH